MGKKQAEQVPLKITYRCSTEGHTGTDVIRTDNFKCQACEKPLVLDRASMSFKHTTPHVVLSVGEIGLSA